MNEEVSRHQIHTLSFSHTYMPSCVARSCIYTTRSNRCEYTYEIRMSVTLHTACTRRSCVCVCVCASLSASRFSCCLVHAHTNAIGGASHVFFLLSPFGTHVSLIISFVRYVCMQLPVPRYAERFSFYFHFSEHGDTLIQCTGRTSTQNKHNFIFMAFFYGHTFACILMAQRECFIRKWIWSIKCRLGGGVDGWI